MTWDVLPDTDDAEFVVRGHVDAAEFVAAVEGYLGVPYGALHLAGEVAHGYYRFVPSTDPDEAPGAYWPARRGPGAFPVTFGGLVSPPPGSDAALALGCRCPVLDRPGDGLAWMSGDCPLHGGM